MSEFLPATVIFDLNFWQSLPPALVVPLLLLVGLLVALGVRLIAARLLEICFFNRLCERVGVAEFLRKGQVQYTPARLTGLLIYWVILLVTLLMALDILGATIVGTMLLQAQAVLPAVVAALGVVVGGYVLVAFCANVIYTLARNGGFIHADLLAKAVRWLGLLLVISLAAEQLGVEFRLIGIALQIILAAAAFGLALAFGLGCKDMARDAMQKYLQHLREKQRSSRSDLEG